MLGGGPPDEDQIPEQLQIQGQILFDFFGLGQQATQQQPENNQDMIQSAPADAIPQDIHWPLWSEALPVNPVQALAINLNVAPPVLEQDLNEIPMVNDPQEVLTYSMNQPDQHVVDFWLEELPAPNQQATPLLQDLNEVPNLEGLAEVLIHPPQVLVQGQDLDWDLMNQEIEMVIDQPELPEQPILEPIDESLPAPPLQNINFLHHEIPVDMLMNGAELASQEFQDGHIQNNVQVGMVKIVEGPPPSIVSNLFGNRSTMLPWEKDAHKMKGSISVNIPADWAAFFCFFVAKPTSFLLG